MKYVYLHFLSIIWFLQFLSQFLFFLKPTKKFTGFYTKFWVEPVKFLVSRCTSLLLHSKPVQQNYLDFFKDFKPKGVLQRLNIWNCLRKIRLNLLSSNCILQRLRCLRHCSYNSNIVCIIVSHEHIFSSIVYWGYQDNFKPVYLFFFFEKKISRAQKHVSSKNQLTKQK